MPVPIAKARFFRNRNQAGRRGTRGRNAAWHVNYCGLDESREARGQWVDREGVMHTHERVQGWAEQQAAEHPYGYHLVLSAGRSPALAGEDLQAVISEDRFFGDYRLIAHTNTPNAHAHIIAFADKLLTRGELDAWRQEACGRIAALEQERALQVQQEAAQQQQQQSLEGGLEL